MSLSVHRPAVANPNDCSGLSVAEFFTEKLKTSNVVLVPPTFELSGDPNKQLGEEAEKKVIEGIEKCGRDIPGIESICFHGVRVIGSSPSIIREVNLSKFQKSYVKFRERRFETSSDISILFDDKS